MSAWPAGPSGPLESVMLAAGAATAGGDISSCSLDVLFCGVMLTRDDAEDEEAEEDDGDAGGDAAAALEADGDSGMIGPSNCS